MREERLGALVENFSRLPAWTLCAHEPRIAEFIPPQRRHCQENRNNSNAFANITLKRHECRAPSTRFMSSPLLKFRTLCDHEPLPGRAELPHSLKVKATQQRRPTNVAPRFLGREQFQQLDTDRDCGAKSLVWSSIFIRPIFAILTVLVLGFGNVSVSGELSEEEVNDLFSQGKDFFREANEATAANSDKAKELYQKAALRFERIVREGGIQNGKLLYNIGNAYFQLNNIGRAILNYRRAEQFIPNDPNLQQNLQYARDRRQDKIEEPQKTRVLKTLFFWHYDISSEIRVRLFSISFCLVWITAGLRLFIARGSLNWCIGLSGFFAVIFLGSLLVDSASRHKYRPGVVIDYEVVARKGDSDTYEPSFTDPLHTGTEFVLVEDRDNWYQVELANSQKCWLPAKAVELVR